MSSPVEIKKTEIEGVLEIHPRVFEDKRGFFTETYNKETWQAAGFSENFVQDNLSLSCKGTLRGMHYQIHPHPMGKLVRCLRGAVHDVAVDIRKGSPTFGQYVARELTGENNMWLWVPVGFAHGFVALEDDSLVYYKCTGTYCPETERSVLYSDPTIGIAWLLEPTKVTDKDAVAPPLAEADYNFTYSETA